MTIDKIKEIRAKLISNRRTRIKPEDEDAGGKGEIASALGDFEVIGLIKFDIFLIDPDIGNGVLLQTFPST